jgi:cytochrome d ubiquinol oxidase subunit I
MLGIGLWSLLRRLQKHKLFDDRWLHRAALLMTPSGFVAVLAGWITTEVGRQPYTIYGLLTTVESASPIAAPAVATSFVAFIVVYFFVFGAGMFYILRLCGKSPDSVDPEMHGPSHAAGINPGPVLKAGE